MAAPLALACSLVLLGAVAAARGSELPALELPAPLQHRADVQTSRRLYQELAQSQWPEVAVVNEVAAHWEVLAGVLEVLRRLRVKPHIFFVGNELAPTNLDLPGWLGPAFMTTANWHLANQTVPLKPRLVICVSPELAPRVCKDALDVLKPSLLVEVVHRADTATPTGRVLRLHSPFRLLALAPHVATLAQARYRTPVEWTMPVAPFRQQAPCLEASCFNGFAVQGMLRKYKSKWGNGFTRSYFLLWSRLLELKKASPAGTPPVRVAVLGKGLREALKIPAELDSDVEFHSQLPYPAFWARIAGSLALVPAFGMPVYTESRISSTILASLITSTPLISDQAILDAYKFLRPEHVFLRLPGEDEAAAMHRVARMPVTEVLARRRALAVLRKELNQHACKTMAGLLREASQLGQASASVAV